MNVASWRRRLNVASWRRRGVVSATVLVVAGVAVPTVVITQVWRPTAHPAPAVPASPASGRPRSSTAPPATTPAPSSTAPSIAPASRTPDPALARRSAVDSAVRALTAQLPAGGVSIAALNTATGARYSYGADGGMLTGSVVKIYILETLLLQHQDKGTPLSDQEAATARTMIENSDNAAAETLYYAIGGRAGLVAAGPRLGLTHTIPGPNPDFKGLTRTSATDCIVLLQNLLRPAPLREYARSVVLGFMRNVEADQRWGVGVIADPGTTFANKNGWLSVDADNPDSLGDGGRWLVNSVGILTVHHQQVLMAVLTQHGPSFDSGVRLVESLARTITPAVAR